MRLVAVNALIAAILAMVLLDALPQTPPAVAELVKPIVRPLGLGQHWQVFAPEPDSLNMRIRAEITYRDGHRVVWRSPDWPQLSAWQRFLGHRREEWLDNSWGQEDAGVWTPWARYLARTLRPDDPEADRGAEVRFIAENYQIPPAEIRPWRSWREPVVFDKRYDETLTIETLP